MKILFYALPRKVQRHLGWRIRHVQRYKAYKKCDLGYRYFNNLEVSMKKDWIFNRISNITQYAQEHNPFYRKFYGDCDFNSRLLKNFDDLSNIPIVTKELLRLSADSWMQHLPKYSISNTGGTSGSPLKFLLSKTQGIREYYYIDRIWERIGGTRKNNRAVFRGKNLGDVSWKYSPDYDAYFINMYKPMSEIAQDLFYFFSSHQIQYLHGYPSTLYQFASSCLKSENTRLRQCVNEHLCGILLASEYPAPCYRDVIEKAFPVVSLSFYGHTECTILAVEGNVPFIYKPYHSYGFCEAVDLDDGNTHLVGTCYDNIASPFIRYDLGDSILPVEFDEGLLSSFKIDKGRIGEYILDRDLNPISLTALIFGRHHVAFENVEFIQVSQIKPGYAKIHITTRPSITTIDVASMFDFSNINIVFEFQLQDSPIRTKRGKIPLLISL